MTPIAKTVVIFLLLLSPLVAARENCNWCVFGNEKITNEVLTLARLKPKELLKAIRAKGVCIQVMASRRKIVSKAFVWSKAEAPTLSHSKVANFGGVMGKMLCRAEQPIAAKCPLIVLAADAPFSTLLHEYLHFIQAQRDANWCKLSKELWIRGSNEKDWEQKRDKEWDAQLFLWHNRSKMPLTYEDKIAITSEIINEAESRKSIDPDAQRFLELEKPREYLRALTEDQKRRH